MNSLTVAVDGPCTCFASLTAVALTGLVLVLVLNLELLCLALGLDLLFYSPGLEH